MAEYEKNNKEKDQTNGNFFENSERYKRMINCNIRALDPVEDQVRDRF